MGMRVKLHSADHPNQLLRELNRCRLAETLCDVTIVVGARSFPAHKAVLACAAGYFQNLFLTAGLDAARTFVVDFITPANFEKILSFVYTAELFTDLINVGVIYEVAERLGMDALLRACHATFPDLHREGAAPAPPLLPITDGAGDSGLLGTPALAGVAGGGYEEEGPGVGEAMPGLPPPQAEGREAPGPCVPAAPGVPRLGLGGQTGPGPRSPFGGQSNGERVGFLGAGSLDGDGGAGRGRGFGSPAGLPPGQPTPEAEAGELELEEPGNERPGPGPAEEVIELSDDSEEELTPAATDGGAAEGEEARTGAAEESWAAGGHQAQPCQVCHKVLEPNVQLIRQHARDHVDLLTGNCKVCETHFHDRGARVAHVLSHIGIFLFACDMCEAKFFTQWQLTLHRRERAPPEPPAPTGPLPPSAPALSCAACGKALARDFATVRAHVLDHLSVPGQTCSVCAQQHLSLCSLMWHTLSHLGISVFSCAVCARSFIDRHILDRHLALHRRADDAPFRCHVCGHGFRSEAAYRYHVSQHEGGGGGPDGRTGPAERPQPPALSKRRPPADGGTAAAEGPAPPAPSKYGCKVCGKRFAHTSEFNYHRRIHTGEKPYQCKVCHKFFRGRSTIKCHLKTHAGALMYRCTVCGHYSSTLNLMSKHVGVHKGSLPADFTIEQTFMYVIHSKEADRGPDS